MFELTPRANGQWKEAILHRFDGSDSAFPIGTPVFDTTGNLYGTTDQGFGEVFELSPESHGWRLSLLQAGAGRAYFALLLDSDGNLYAPMGAGMYGQGAISELVKDDDWTENWLYSFCAKKNRNNWCLDGTDARAGVVWGPDGSLYGTTVEFGVHGYGVVYQLTQQQDGTWKEAVLHSFPAFKGDGMKLYEGVVLDQAGNIYGATYQGGSSTGCGVLFSWPRRGTASGRKAS